MAELEPGHPDELIEVLTNWLRESQSNCGSLYPPGTDPVEWVARRFIAYWRSPARAAIDSIELSLQHAMDLCDSVPGAEAIKDEIDGIRQTLQEDLRDHLGIYDWNREDA